MAVYHKFDKSDIIHYSLTTSPKSTFASGTSGWRASTGASGSISMYGGIRSRETIGTGLTIQPIYLLDTHSIDGKIELSASYPFTGSISYVQVVDRNLDRDSEVHDSLWGDEHFQPIMNLYDYYSRTNSNYTTSSCDYYMLYSEAGSLNKVVYSGSFITMSSSFTIEAMIKPLSILGNENYTITSRKNLWSLFITGSTGRLAFSASDGSGLVLTSSISVTKDRWQHVAYRVGNNSGSFHIDMNDAGEYVSTGSIVNDIISAISHPPVNIFYDEARPDSSFHGFAHDFKLWNIKRTNLQMSSSFDRTMFQSGSNNLLIYSRFNDGPHETIDYLIQGSGSLNHSATHLTSSAVDSTTPEDTTTLNGSVSPGAAAIQVSVNISHWPTKGQIIISEGLPEEEILHYHTISSGLIRLQQGAGEANQNTHLTGATVRRLLKTDARLVNFNSRSAPIWHPNDNVSFIVPKVNKRNTVDELRVIHIPSLFYGRQIATGSVKLICNSYLSSSLQRVLVDDGRGGLYLSGSATSSSLDSREEYQGVSWNKVGNVFYSEGLVIIKDPALLDFGAINTDSPMQNDLLEVSFAGLQSIPTKVFMCRIDGAEANCSYNPSYSSRNSSGKLQINQDKPVTWITTVGLYNKDRKLVGVAKLASPLRNREKDKINVKLKLDF